MEYLDDENREIINECEECVGDVTSCHENIHFHSTGKEYNCSDSMALYVAKYFPRYVKEIKDALSKIKSPWNEEEVWILSVGNGPSSDLYGFLDDRGSEESKIIYKGIDMNPNWDYINQITKEEILTSDSNCEVRFQEGDIFEEINDYNCPKGKVWKYKFLVFQYVISAMVNDSNTTKEDIEQFLDKVIDQMVVKMPKDSYIIFNDINHNKVARDYFEYFFKKVKKVIKGRVGRYYYKGDYKYGNVHDSYQTPKKHENKYMNRSYCTGAQLIIKKESNR